MASFEQLITNRSSCDKATAMTENLELQEKTSSKCENQNDSKLKGIKYHYKKENVGWHWNREITQNLK